VRGGEGGTKGQRHHHQRRQQHEQQPWQVVIRGWSRRVEGNERKWVRL